MNNTDIKNKILGLFTENNRAVLSFELICGELGIPRKLKRQTRGIIDAMVAEGIVARKGGGYYLKTQRPSPLPPTPGKQLSPNLIEGFFDATPLARNYSYAFVRTDQGDYFISSEDTLNAYHNDKVAIEANQRRKGKQSAAVRRIIQRANPQLAGDLVDSGGRMIFVCSNPKIHNWFEVTDHGTAHPGQKVILRVTNWGNPLSSKYPMGVITEVLGLSGDPQVELLAVIRQYGLPLEFPPEVVAAAEALDPPSTRIELQSRVDLRELFTFTIDPASAKDFDDAISIVEHERGWTLWVHIADVAHYVKVGSPLFNEAAKRGNSFYFPKKVIPMLPERISNLLCSLRPDEDKFTMTVVTEFNNKGKVVSQKLVESVICSDHRLSYEEVDALFEGKSTDITDQLRATLESARNLSALLTRHRLDEGYIFFDLPEIEYQYDSEGFVHRLNLAEETESHKLIENFMLVANEYVAAQLTKRSPVTIYRIHEDPDTRKLERLAETLGHYGLALYDTGDPNRSLQQLISSMPSAEYHAVFDRMILRSMKKASYSIEHIRHFGLGMETYTHFTSPIRRLCDLVVHHLCKMYLLRSEKPELNRKQVQNFAQTSNEQELQADSSERDIERIYSNTFMKKHIGEKFTGMVIATNSNGLVIRLNEIPVSALLKPANLHKYPWQYLDREMRYVNRSSGDYYQLMDKVKVTVIDVSDDIYLELTDANDAHAHIYTPPGQTPRRHRITMGDKHKRNSPRNQIDAKRSPGKSGAKQATGTRNKKK